MMRNVELRMLKASFIVIKNNNHIIINEWENYMGKLTVSTTVLEAVQPFYSHFTFQFIYRKVSKIVVSKLQIYVFCC